MHDKTIVSTEIIERLSSYWGFFSHEDNAPHYDLREVLYRVTGNDFTVIPGLETLSIQNIIAEVGLDPTRWRTEKHFVHGWD